MAAHTHGARMEARVYFFGVSSVFLHSYWVLQIELSSSGFMRIIFTS